MRPGTAPLADEPAGIVLEIRDRVTRRLEARAEPVRTAATPAAIAAAAAASSPARLDRLRDLFGLSPGEVDLVRLVAAVELDPDLGPALAVLQGPGRSYPTEVVAAALFERGRARTLVPESPLLRWHIVRVDDVGPGEPPAIRLDASVCDWLLGERVLDAELVGAAALVMPRPVLTDWPVAAAVELALRTAAPAAARPRASRTILLGAPGGGRATFAAVVCAELGLPLLAIDCDRIAAEDWARTHVVAHRRAFLDGCALLWRGETAWTRRWPSVPVAFPLQFVVGESGDDLEAVPEVTDQVIELPAACIADRRRLWVEVVPAAATWPPGELDQLAERYRASPADIAEAGAAAETAGQAAAFIRERSRRRLGELARLVDCPFDWADLVVGADVREALEALVFEASHRGALWEEAAARRLFPEGRGLFALFTGPPGTGKTMSAQVVARALGVDLFRISLAAVVSKYVGETAKNLHRILARAEAMEAVLLFDEADALFGRRTEIKDAHDRYANSDTNHLLQAVESYRGVAILTSNKKANIDPAFIRRLRYVIEFPRPDQALRRELWGRILSEIGGAAAAAALAPRLDSLARAVEVTGAQVKYAVLSAVFAARRHGGAMTAGDLIGGLERELVKEGRALSPRDRERLGRGDA